MCGIAGILSTDHSLISKARLKKMTDSIVHRGPEGEAFWIKGEIGFGHRRLCIIDLTSAGVQPMHYLERYTIVFNGELYNYLEIRETLSKKGYHFHTNTDTEVLLAAYACYQEDCLRYFDGMYAFAIWDEQEQQLFAARDRFGEKPFFYCRNQHNNEWLFASEIKALWAGGAAREYDGSMLLNYLSLGWTEHPVDKRKTFYQRIYSLPPAHYLKIKAGRPPVIKRYWTLSTVEEHRKPETAMEAFRSLFHTSVQRRLRSDVAIGTSLSGGLDSSSIVASANRAGNSLYSHKSFSAVFPGFSKDESAFIKLVTKQYHLQNYFTSPVAKDVVNEFKSFMHYHEQPVSTASSFAQYKVYELAKINRVTVLLDGQGADETLAGYQKYINWYLQELWRTNRSAFRKEKEALKANQIPFDWNVKHMLAAFLPTITAGRLKAKVLSIVRNQEQINPAFFHAHLDTNSFFKPVVTSLNDILHFNTCNFGLSELLRYADTNSMAHSREVRLPFLNHELVSFLFSLPAQLKIHEGWSKWLLRTTMSPYLPTEVVWRKEKIGFEPPEHIWMADEEMKELATAGKKRLAALGILSSSFLHKKNQSPGSPATENINWRCMVADALIP